MVSIDDSLLAHFEGLEPRQLAVAVAIPLLGGIGGSVATAKEIKGWYRRITKPSWTPPNWLFGPVWTYLYCAMGFASYLVWRQGGWQAQALPLAVYCLQLALNLAWTPLFFRLHRLDWASYDILGMWAAVAATIWLFGRAIGPSHAALLLGPYLAWVSYAAALTLWIWRHNPSQPGTRPGAPHKSGRMCAPKAPIKPLPLASGRRR